MLMGESKFNDEKLMNNSSRSSAVYSHRELVLVETEIFRWFIFMSWKYFSFLEFCSFFIFFCYARSLYWRHSAKSRHRRRISDLISGILLLLLLLVYYNHPLVPPFVLYSHGAVDFHKIYSLCMLIFSIMYSALLHVIISGGTRDCPLGWHRIEQLELFQYPLLRCWCHGNGCAAASIDI